MSIHEKPHQYRRVSRGLQNDLDRQRYVRFFDHDR